jgi:hypothetical protein
MEQAWLIAIPILMLLVAVFIIKKVVKLALRLALLGALIVLGYILLGSGPNF